MAEDYYKVLGVERGASKEDIKRAYRKLAHQHHPDKENGSEEEFKRVNGAYQVLSDDKKRAQYDQFGEGFEGAQGGAGGFDGGGFDGFNVNVDDLGGMGDIFEQFFGGGGRRAGRQVRRGQDIGIDVSISMAQSAEGLSKEVNLRMHHACSKCRGNGAEPGTPIKECKTCGGKGVVNTTRQTMLGAFTQSAACRECEGEGKTAEQKCSQCRGEGREMKDKKLEIEIPAGIADGQTIRLSGKGEVPRGGGVSGDLYIKVHVEQKEGIRRDGKKACTGVKVSFVEAALGTRMKVPTINGRKEIAIPAGTQPGAVVTVQGLGFPDVNGSERGNLEVTVEVEIPKKLTRAQKKMLEQFGGIKKGLFV